MRHTGFTLVELLVVIGIIALMTAVLFPVLSGVREKGRQTVCLSNERQIGAALLMYAKDSDDYWPADDTGWAGTIYPYVKSVSAFHCPSDATNSQPPYFPISYGVNADLWHVIDVTPQRHVLMPHTMAEVSGKTVLVFEVLHSSAKLMSLDEGLASGRAIPSTMSACGSGGSLADKGFLFGDGTKFGLNENVRYATGTMVGPSFNSGFYQGAGRHQSGANFLFSDAHVKWLPPQQVSTGKDAATPSSDPNLGYGLTTAAGSENTRFAATFSTK